MFVCTYMHLYVYTCRLSVANNAFNVKYNIFFVKVLPQIVCIDELNNCSIHFLCTTFKHVDTIIIENYN